MLKVTYRGPGTGLRLDDPASTAAIDVGGSHAKTAPLHLYVQGKDAKSAGIDLDPAGVVLLIEECAHYLARRHGVIDRKED